MIVSRIVNWTARVVYRGDGKSLKILLRSYIILRCVVAFVTAIILLLSAVGASQVIFSICKEKETTDYGLDGPGSNPGGDEIFRPSRPALGPTQWRTQEFCSGGFKNSVEDRGQRERGSGGGNRLVRGSGGTCNLVQEISFHNKLFLIFDTLRLFMMTTNLFVIANVKQLRT